MKIVICGGGVIGNCLAYFLSERGVHPIVVEKHVIAGGASGKAGGFLARDWNRGCPLDKFSEISYDLHLKLAADLNGKEEYGFRNLESYSVTLEDNAKVGDERIDKCEWLDGKIVTNTVSKIGSVETTSQIHPYMFCKALHSASAKRGTEYITGTSVMNIECVDQHREVKLSDGRTLTADCVVITMGPWSGTAKSWLKSMPCTYGQKAHSITVIPKDPVPPEAVFTTYNHLSPEIYPRPDGEVYVCGMAEFPKPSYELDSIENVSVTAGSCEKIKTIMNDTSATLRDGVVNIKQACYLPLTEDGLPLIGELKNDRGVYVAAGHGCWGILNAPATGLALSQLIIDGKSTLLDLNPFNPNRFND